MPTNIVNQIGAVTTAVVTAPPKPEIKQPFQIDPSGQVAVESDPVQNALAHILAIAFTLPRERVMRPTYGVGVQSLVFSNFDITHFQRAAVALQTALAQTDGIMSTVTVSAVPNPAEPGTYAFSVNFALDSSTVTHEALFDYSGNLIGYS